jgi:chromosome segregation ATPase
MSSKVQAAEAIEALANQYKQMVEAAEMLKKIGSLENAAKEAQKACEAAKDEAEAAKLEADLAKNDAKKAKGKVVEMLDKAIADANETVLQGKQKADQIVAEAESRATEINLAASERISSALADVNANRSKVLAEIADAKQLLEGLMLDIQSKTSEANEAQKKLDKVQAQITKLLG